MNSGNNQPVSVDGAGDADELAKDFEHVMSNTPKLQIRGVSLQPEVECRLMADLNLDSNPRTVMIFIELVRKSSELPDGGTLPGGLVSTTSLVIPFGWTNLQTLNYSDNLPPVNDPGCVIDLAGFARPKFSGTYGQAGAFIEMKSLLEQSIARMVCRNSVVKAKAKTIAGVRHINFRIDGGYTGQLQSSLLLTTEQIKETSVVVPVDPERAALFFEFQNVETSSTVGA